MKDRMVAGGVAGLIGAAVQNIYSYVMVGLNLAQFTYSDFATSVLTNRVYSDSLGLVAGFVAYLSVGVILGILFAYLISATSNDYLYVKGLFYGFILWFLLTGFGTAFRLPAFLNLPPVSTLSILVGGLIFGVITAFVLKQLDHETALV